MYINPYKEIILPTLDVIGDINEAKEEENKTATNYKGTVKIGPFAIFKNNIYLSTLSFEESKYLNIIRNNLNNTTITVFYGDGYITFELYNIKAKIDADIDDNLVKLTINGKAKAYEISSNTDIENVDNVKDIQKYFNKYVEENTLNTFNNLRNIYNTDIFNFEDAYYKKNPNYLNKYYRNWYDKIFPNLNLKVNAKIQLYEKGKIEEEIKYVKEN